MALGSVADDADNSGYFQVAYDMEYLYLLVSITDNDPVDLPAASTQPWNNDGIELFLDHADRSFEGGVRIDGEQHQFRCNLSQADNPMIGGKGMPGFFGDNDTTNINYAQIKGAIGYSIELKVPMATVYRKATKTNKDALAAASGSLKKFCKS